MVTVHKQTISGKKVKPNVPSGGGGCFSPSSGGPETNDVYKGVLSGKLDYRDYFSHQDYEYLLEKEKIGKNL